MARSNYIKVKDEDKFLEVIEDWNCQHIETMIHGEKLHGFISENGLPTYCQSKEDEGDEDYSSDAFIDELIQLIAEDEVLVITEVGNENMRYLHGWAMAVDSKGEYKSINLNDEIMAIAKGMSKKKVTEPTY